MSGEEGEERGEEGTKKEVDIKGAPTSCPSLICYHGQRRTGQVRGGFCLRGSGSTPVSLFLHIHSVLVAQVLNKNSLLIPVVLESERKTIETLGLIDSGAGGKFIDQNFAKEEGLETKDLEKPVMVYNVDGTLNKKGTFRKYVEFPMIINGKKTLERLMVTGLGKLKIILRFPCLNEQNPVIDWKLGMVSFPEKKKINWKWIIGTKTPKASFKEEVDEEKWKNSTINRLDEDETSILMATLTGVTNIFTFTFYLHFLIHGLLL